MPAPKKAATTKKAAPAAPAVEKSEVKGSGNTKPITETSPVAPAPAAAPAKPAARTVTHDMIAKRAFEIYASRGYAPGNPDADWHEAERQLKAGL